MIRSKSALAEDFALFAIGQRENAELLFPVMERHGQIGFGLERLLAKPGEAVVGFGLLGVDGDAGTGNFGHDGVGVGRDGLQTEEGLEVLLLGGELVGDDVVDLERGGEKRR